MSAEVVCLPEDLDLRALSYELRTPLVPILGLTQQLLKTALTSEQKSYIVDIFEAGNRLAILANKLLEIRKISSINTPFDDNELQILKKLLTQKKE